MRHLVTPVLFSLCLLAACGRGQPEAESLNQVSAPAAPGDARQADAKEQRKVESAGGAAEPSAARRYLAVRHDLRIETEAESVETAWREAQQACEAAGCELLSSALTRDSSRRPAHAEIEARVPPDKVEGFLKQVSALGSVGQHSRNAEDKTDEVIDTEAKLKNMAEFRDNLRRLMATPGAKLKDLIDVERELARVQGELDSLASRRKALASQTDKVRMNLAFVARPRAMEAGVWSPVGDAVTGAGRVLADSLAALITFVAAVLPWAIGLAGVGAVVRALWRRRRARKAAAAVRT